jgi:glycosyltransferase involved in cell wall biosynthesis
MQAGLPIVTTRSRGAADHLSEGIHALFPAPGDAEALRAALARLLDDPKRMAAMGWNNRDRLKAFAKEAVAREYLEALARIARERGLSLEA